MSEEPSYAEASATAYRRAAESLGADYSIDARARAALGDQLAFLRKNPALIHDPVALANGDLTMIYGWACDDEAAIVLGRLRDRGWTLARSRLREAVRNAGEAVG